MPRSLEREASPILSRYPAVWLHRALPTPHRARRRCGCTRFARTMDGPQYRLRRHSAEAWLTSRGPVEELLILDAPNEVARGVVYTGGNSAASERRAPFASASSATVPALNFKGLVRTVAAVSGR
jgi:hypothetical protein